MHKRALEYIIMILEIEHLSFPSGHEETIRVFVDLFFTLEYRLLKTLDIK